jgi:hypothetical protein
MFCVWLSEFLGEPVHCGSRLEDLDRAVLLWLAIATVEYEILGSTLPEDLLDACDTILDLYSWIESRTHDIGRFP